MKNILIVDPKGVIIRGGFQTIKRHAHYAKELGIATQNQIRLIIVTKAFEQHKEIFSDNMFFIYFPTIKFTKFFQTLSTWRRLKKEDIELVVVGDPWIPFYASLFLRIFFGQRIPIQVQLHGDLFSEEWRSSGPKAVMKSFLSLPALRMAKSVRFVSQKQLTNGLKKFPWLREKSFVAPVYMDLQNLGSYEKNRKTHNPIKIGVLGRIHQDRGLDKLVPFFSPIINSGLKIRLLIAGEGEYKKQLQDQIGVSGIADKVTFMDFLEGKKLADYFQEIDLLISFAPSESFGRSIREALWCGVPIWAVPSSGVLELKELVENGEVTLIDLTLPPQEQIFILETILKQTICTSTREKIELQNSQSVEKLIASWTKLSNSNSDRKFYEK